MSFDFFFEESGSPAPPPLVRKGRLRWLAGPKGKEGEERWCSGCRKWLPLVAAFRGYTRCVPCRVKANKGYWRKGAERVNASRRVKREGRFCGACYGIPDRLCRKCLASRQDVS